MVADPSKFVSVYMILEKAKPVIRNVSEKYEEKPKKFFVFVINKFK